MFLSVAGGLELFTLTGTPTQGGIQGSAGSVSNTSDSGLFHEHVVMSRKRCSFDINLCRKAEPKVLGFFLVALFKGFGVVSHQFVE